MTGAVHSVYLGCNDSYRHVDRMIQYHNTVREKASLTRGVRNVGVARQEQVRILRMGYTDHANQMVGPIDKT